MSMGQVYAGKLVSGKSVIKIEGDVDRGICEFAFKRLEEFLNQGIEQIIFDCSEVLNLPQWWFDNEVNERGLTADQIGRVKFLQAAPQDSLKSELIFD